MMTVVVAPLRAQPTQAERKTIQKCCLQNKQHVTLHHIRSQHIAHHTAWQKNAKNKQASGNHGQPHAFTWPQPSPLNWQRSSSNQHQRLPLGMPGSPGWPGIRKHGAAEFWLRCWTRLRHCFPLLLTMRQNLALEDPRLNY